MEINKLSANYPTNLSAEKKPVAPAEARPVSPQASKESISGDWQLLEQAEQELATIDEVDMDKVNALRAALSEGRFDLNLADLAQSMLEQHG
ncbi:flagellar biosynthesis anti-sigma factor FlgM [Ferrimonas balearica]|uniref:flagellar biosynthesis anti-sigma factor FlgM n=1 Tax=Ferrimonas balearica TaxID=44012 RepID=UPI001C993AF0|nr:flagellar biosynthesis anti-sigma factor FlgM [Ferrimonas balearica]MBY5991984.1 flagellar biosynthesis anti-sigma factor FlgM [Ferrimonas balearica]